MINIADLLRNAKKGTILWSPLFGPVEFMQLGKNDQIWVKVDNSEPFDKYGRYFGSRFTKAECLLFPSKECRTWENFKLPTKPKFKVGDWIVQNDDGAVSQITKIINEKDEDGEYRAYEHTNGYFAECFDDEFHFWTIQDAKDGDVLVDTLSGTRALTILFRFINADDSISAYCGWNGHTFRVTIDGLGYGTLSSTQYVPATKEQRDLLFQKMKEAGYEWDADKKELRNIINPKFKVGDKIQAKDTKMYVYTVLSVDLQNQEYLVEHNYKHKLLFTQQDNFELVPAPKLHYDIASFYAGMPVLVRDNKDQEWRYTTFSHISSRFRKIKFAAGCTYWCQCIPFEGNETLLGTTDICNERFINW